jgi:hypothetical protein
MPLPLIGWVVYLWRLPRSTSWSTFTKGIRNEGCFPVPIQVRIPIKTNKNKISNYIYKCTLKISEIIPTIYNP